jgi:hypothetical protein
VATTIAGLPSIQLVVILDTEPIEGSNFEFEDNDLAELLIEAGQTRESASVREAPRPRSEREASAIVLAATEGV